MKGVQHNSGATCYVDNLNDWKNILVRLQYVSGRRGAEGTQFQVLRLLPYAISRPCRIITIIIIIMKGTTKLGLDYNDTYVQVSWASFWPASQP